VKVRKRISFSFDYGSEVEEDSFFSTSAEASAGEEEDEVLFALQNSKLRKLSLSF